MEVAQLWELKKQACFFFKEKMREARLAFTDVTLPQLLAEEATGGNPWPPDTRTMGAISTAAFEVDNYWRVVEILHRRFSRMGRKQWRESYNGLVLLEYLLLHGPLSFSEEFLADAADIREVGRLHHIDEKGFNWGLVMRSKSERVLKLLENRTLLHEERRRAREVTRRIGRYGKSSTFTSGSQREEAAPKLYGRSHSYNEYEKHLGVALVGDDLNRCYNSGGCTAALPLLSGGGGKERQKEEQQHPFCQLEDQSRESLLSS